MTNGVVPLYGHDLTNIGLLNLRKKNERKALDGVTVGLTKT